jgi:RNA polymerase sigma-B factor
VPFSIERPVPPGPLASPLLESHPAGSCDPAAAGDPVDSPGATADAAIAADIEVAAHPDVAADPGAAAVAADREFDDPGLPARRQGDEIRTQRLFKRAEAARSAAARQRLLNEVVLLNQGMALRIAHRYRNRGIEVEDLEQVALLALIKAVRRFEPGRGRAFAAYAAPSIAGDLKKHFRDHGWGVRPPRAIQELVLSVRSTASDLSQTLHHEPTVAEVAEELQVETDDVAQAMIATQNFAPVSLDAPAPGSEVPVGDLIVDETDDYARVEVMSQLRPAIAGLSARDRMILHMRFIDACTQSEIGTALGISQMQVSRRLTSILHQLRSHLQEPAQQDAVAVASRD